MATSKTDQVTTKKPQPAKIVLIVVALLAGSLLVHHIQKRTNREPRGSADSLSGNPAPTANESGNREYFPQMSKVEISISNGDTTVTWPDGDDFSSMRIDENNQTTKSADSSLAKSAYNQFVAARKQSGIADFVNCTVSIYGSDGTPRVSDVNGKITSSSSSQD